MSDTKRTQQATSVDTLGQRVENDAPGRHDQRLEAALALRIALVGTGPRYVHTVLSDLIDCTDELIEAVEQRDEELAEIRVNAHSTYSRGYNAAIEAAIKNIRLNEEPEISEYKIAFNDGLHSAEESIAALRKGGEDESNSNS